MIIQTPSLKRSMRKINRMANEGKQAIQLQKEPKPKKRTTKVKRKRVKKIETKTAIYSYIEVVDK